MSYMDKSCELFYLRQSHSRTMFVCRQLDLEALVAAIRALEALAHERTVARLKLESDDVTSGSGSLQERLYTLPYDPAAVFLLETMVSIIRKTPQHIEDTWYA